MKKFVFDLDNTIIYTDSLNNESYNYALKKYGLMPIKDCKRITRDILFGIYSEFDESKKNQIINSKQEYFLDNLKSTFPNRRVLKLLKSLPNNSCVIWTSAEEERVKAILDYYKISDSFKQIFFSRKNDIKGDVLEICKILECELEDIVFYEDNKMVIHNLRQLQLDVIDVEVSANNKYILSKI